MAGIKESVVRETLVYNIDPQTLADACQDALKKVGKVRQVTRETGMIFGEIKVGLITNVATATLRISKKGDVSELSIQVNRIEGITRNTSGAQEALMKFINALGGEERLKGKSSAGW